MNSSRKMNEVFHLRVVLNYTYGLIRLLDYAYNMLSVCFFLRVFRIKRWKGADLLFRDVFEDCLSSYMSEKRVRVDVRIFIGDYSVTHFIDNG